MSRENAVWKYIDNLGTFSEKIYGGPCPGRNIPVGRLLHTNMFERHWKTIKPNMQLHVLTKVKDKTKNPTVYNSI